MIKRILDITKKHTTLDYPWGFKLRCQVDYTVEFKPSKGFRNVFQSTNPKTNKLCAPKLDVYSHFVYMYENEEGHIKQGGMYNHGIEDTLRIFAFIVKHFDALNLPTNYKNYIIETAIFTIMSACVYERNENIYSMKFWEILFKPTIDKLESCLSNQQITKENFIIDINLDSIKNYTE